MLNEHNQIAFTSSSQVCLVYNVRYSALEASPEKGLLVRIASFPCSALSFGGGGWSMGTRLGVATWLSSGFLPTTL